MCPPFARLQVANKGAQDDLMEKYEVVILTKGTHVLPGKKPPADERKFDLEVGGRVQLNVKNCKAEIRRILEVRSQFACRFSVPHVCASHPIVMKLISTVNGASLNSVGWNIV